MHLFLVTELIKVQIMPKSYEWLQNQSTAQSVCGCEDCGCSSSDSEKCESGRRDNRKVYLITYSQADKSKIPTRNSFAEAVLKAFYGSSAKALHWCCSPESHKKSGVHYNMCQKLDRNQLLLRAKNFLHEHYRISVHFSSVHANYYTAWRYVTKEDENSLKSEGHPDLNDSEGPSTSKARIAKRSRRILRTCDGKRQPKQPDTDTSHPSDDKDSTQKRTKKRVKKRKRLSAYEVSEINLNQRYMHAATPRHLKRSK